MRLPTPITITPISEEKINNNERVSVNSDSIFVTRVGREFGPDGTIFEKRVRVGIKYYESDIDSDTIKTRFGSYNEANLKIRYWNGRSYEDIVMDYVDTVNNIVYGYVNHFSEYVIVYDPRLTSATNTKFVYPTKNPVLANMTGLHSEEKGTTFKIDYNENQVSNFAVEIYNLRGQKIASLYRVSNELYWDGLSSSKQFIGSGLYIYKATVTLTTGEVITTTKPIGVLKQ